MTLTGLGFGISLILAALELFNIIHIGWWLVAAPFLAAIGISVLFWVIGAVIGLIILLIAGK